MAILTGFPASNTIQIGTRFPKIVKKKAIISDLTYKDRFLHRDGEFFMLPNEHPAWMPIAICYRSKDEHDLGRLYGFTEATEVIHLFEDWSWQLEDDPGL